jgi:DNA-binding NarL/FixJ family response regulator
MLVDEDYDMARIRDLKRQVRVILVDDHAVIRNAVRSLLESFTRFDVCGEGTTGVEAIQLSKVIRPDVAVLNISMPEMDGFAAARVIHADHPSCAIVILSSHKDEQIVAAAREIGVQAFVDKSEAARELVNAIEEAEIGKESAVS